MMGYSERYFPVRRLGWHPLARRGFSASGICQEVAACCLYANFTQSILIDMSTNVDVDFSVAWTPEKIRKTALEHAGLLGQWLLLICGDNCTRICCSYWWTPRAGMDSKPV